MLIGQGLGCINDIMNGLIDERDVWLVISEFSDGTDEGWEAIIKQNRARLWGEDQESQIKGATIFWRIFDAGKILQPCPRRPKGKPFPLRSQVWLDFPGRS
jgi:hypothetical protein